MHYSKALIQASVSFSDAVTLLQLYMTTAHNCLLQREQFLHHCIVQYNTIVSDAFLRCSNLLFFFFIVGICNSFNMGKALLTTIQHSLAVASLQQWQTPGAKLIKLFGGKF